MITPITRKELYLAKTIGEDVDIPETAKTREELFFLKILDNFSKIPEPITREELFLAKISGQDVELPEPKTRLELFLAKAAGVDIETPTPITREEIFWSNYSTIVEFEVEGVPPLTYKAIEGTLENYRIYGNTVDGESVGDRTGNLAPNLGRWVDGYLKQSDGTLMNVTSAKEKTSPFIEVNSNDEFTFSYDIGSNEKWAAVAFYDENKNFIFRSAQYTVIPFTFIVNIENAKFIRLSCNTFDSEIYPNLNSGSTALPYEPYGYKVPVTVEGKNLLQNTATSRTVNGVEFTINANGSVTCNRQATGTIYFKIDSGFTLPVGEFVLTGCPTGGGNLSYRVYIQTDNASPQKYYTDTGNGVTINNTNADTVYSARISIVSGYTCNNLTFYPMIRKAGIEDDTYEPYHTPITTPIYLPEPIKMVGDEAEYIDYGEQKFVKKFYKITLNFDDMNNDEAFPGWSGGTAVVEYCNKIRSLAINTPDGYMPFQYSSISNFKAIINVRNNRSILFLGASFDIGHTQSELKEIYAGRSITFILKIPDTELDVTLPALPTLAGTNVLTVGTEVQPSKVYIKGQKERD